MFQKVHKEFVKLIHIGIKQFSPNFPKRHNHVIDSI